MTRVLALEDDLILGQRRRKSRDRRLRVGANQLAESYRQDAKQRVLNSLLSILPGESRQHDISEAGSKPVGYGQPLAFPTTVDTTVASQH